MDAVYCLVKNGFHYFNNGTYGSVVFNKIMCRIKKKKINITLSVNQFSSNITHNSNNT